MSLYTINIDDKAVMISIKPKYCELIANGKKTVEVRKSRNESN